MQNSTTQKSIKEEVLSVKHFFKLYEKEKRKYPSFLFCLNGSIKAKKRKSVDFNLFKKIVKNYLTVYFYNFYMSKGSRYFPLGGFMKKVLYDQWREPDDFRRRPDGTRMGSDGSIGLFWYMRPTRKIYYMTKLIKMAGSTSSLMKIENIYKNNNDKDLLPNFVSEIKKAQNNKTLVKCSPI